MKCCVFARLQILRFTTFVYHQPSTLCARALATPRAVFGQATRNRDSKTGLSFARLITCQGQVIDSRPSITGHLKETSANFGCWFLELTAGIDAPDRTSKVPSRSSRCRANSAHSKQPRPDSGPGFRVKVLKTCQVVPFSLGSGYPDRPCRAWRPSSGGRPPPVRKEDIRLPGKGHLNSHGARPVH